MPDNAIEIDRVSKRFILHPERRTGVKERFVRGRAPKGREFWALKDVSLSIPRGTSVGIIGHNGSGKSTALKVLAGIYRPTTGQVRVDGRVSALLELGAGFHPELTGRENIRLNAAILGMSKRQVDATMDDIIDFSGIEEFIDTPTKVYSSGMYVRLGFAVAVKADPEILVVDEVIAVGDEEFQRRCMDYLSELRRQGSTVVLVSHSMAAVENVCRDAVWLDHGRVLATGPASEVVSKYMAHVNADESFSGGGTGRGPEDVDANRVGTGEIKVTGIEVLDDSGELAASLVMERAGGIRVHYTASERVDQVVFGLGFVHESGVTAAGPNSRRTGLRSLEAGQGFVDFQMESVLLSAGTYAVSTAIVEGGHFFDFLDKAFSVRVVPSGVHEPGIMIQPGRWTGSRLADPAGIADRGTADA